MKRTIAILILLLVLAGCQNAIVQTETPAAPGSLPTVAETIVPVTPEPEPTATSSLSFPPGFTHITSHNAAEYHPKFVPHMPGWIMYTINDRNTIELRMLNLESGEEYELPIEQNGALHFEFVPGANAFIFDGYNGESPPYSIFYYDMDTETSTQLRSISGYPCVSPDGSLVAYAGPGSRMHISNVDGSDKQILTSQQAGYEMCSWAPDGSQIAITREMNDNSELWLITPEGEDILQLTTDPARDYWPAFSPDGTKIAFTSDRSGNYDIWVLDLASMELTQITDSRSTDNQPCWSPDGSALLFASMRRGSQDLWLYTFEE